MNAAAITAICGQVAGPAAMSVRIATWWAHGHLYSPRVAIRQLAAILAQWLSGVLVLVAVAAGGFPWIALPAWVVLTYLLAPLIGVASISAATGLTWPQVNARLDWKISRGGR